MKTPLNQKINSAVLVALSLMSVSAFAGVVKYDDGFIQFHESAGGKFGYHEVIDKDTTGKYKRVIIKEQDEEIENFLASEADEVEANSNLGRLVKSLRGLGYEGSDREVLTQFSNDQK